MIVVNYAKIKKLTLNKIAKIFTICNTLNDFNISIAVASNNNVFIPGIDMTMSKARLYLIEY